MPQVPKETTQPFISIISTAYN